jgi:hypothetical protein
VTWRKDASIFFGNIMFSDMCGVKNPTGKFTSNSNGKNDKKEYGDHISAKYHVN